MTNEPLDEEGLKLLEDYLARLQAGERPDRDAIVGEHPELASALDCLDALEQLAPPSPRKGATRSGADADTEPTLDWGELPRDFGPYVLMREIGRGGMGVVYEARQKGLDRSVAVKMILAGHLASPDVIRRFQTEAKAAARMRHSNIVHIHEVGQLNGQDFFAMEYIEGQSLAERIRQQPIDVPTAVRLVATVARAVEHLHQQGIIHRDLKPSNILLDSDGQPYVTDFGLAKVFIGASDMTATGVIAGTPSYMAPEQASGHRAEISPATDVYSLGAILYELLTGSPPFREETAMDTLMAVLGSDPAMPRTLNPRIPRGLELICMKCLAKEPCERYASAAALADDLDRFARGEALAVRPPTLAQRFWSWTRRQPALASRLGALGVFSVVETVNYLVGTVDCVFHAGVSLVILLWVVVSVVCQQLLESRRWSFPARYVWGTLDSLALLVVLLIADGAASSLVVGYPLIIVASGLWYRKRFVWYITVLSLLSYGVLLIKLHIAVHSGQVASRLEAFTYPDRHVIFAISLVVLGSLVSYLVERLRVLSSFYGRPL
jgi:eukaryotic-like serine/threonine-protein kinase